MRVTDSNYRHMRWVQIARRHVMRGALLKRRMLVTIPYHSVDVLVYSGGVDEYIRFRSVHKTRRLTKS